ncbi:MAG: GAF domain-containing protein [Alphaproteobacteria bacterium]|nr:GAF domain-containing protein [Alphaproteobacteria bacterium]
MDASHGLAAHVPPAAIDDPTRLAALRRTGLLDQPPDPAFDRLTRLLSRLLAAPIAVVSLVDADRHVLLSQRGIAEPWASRRQVPLDHGLCPRVVVAGEALVVGDARADTRLRDHPAIAAHGVVAYAGLPLVDPDGVAIGTVCVADRVPRTWTPDDLSTLADLTAMAMSEIALRRELTERKAVEERLTLAVAEIDHRVKNSLTVTRSLLEMQARATDDEAAKAQLEEAAARVSTIAHVHDRLYRTEATGAVELADYLRALCDDLCRALGVPQGDRHVAIFAAPCVVPADRAVSLGLIVTQLATRAVKIGDGSLRLAFVEEAPGRYLLTVADAGREDPEDAAPRRGIGMRLVTVLVRQLDGEIATGADGGIRIELPAAALA